MPLHEVGDYGPPKVAEAFCAGRDVHLALEIRETALNHHLEIAGGNYADNRHRFRAGCTSCSCVTITESFHGRAILTSCETLTAVRTDCRTNASDPRSIVQRACCAARSMD